MTHESAVCNVCISEILCGHDPCYCVVRYVSAFSCNPYCLTAAVRLLFHETYLWQVRISERPSKNLSSAQTSGLSTTCIRFTSLVQSRCLRPNVTKVATRAPLAQMWFRNILEHFKLVLYNIDVTAICSVTKCKQSSFIDY